MLFACLLVFCTGRIRRQIGAKWSTAKEGFDRGLKGFAVILILVTAIGEIRGLADGKVLFLYEQDGADIAFAAQNAAVPVVYWYNGNLAWMTWDDSLELMQYDEIYFADLADTSPIEDGRIASADRVLVYAARSDNTDAALEAVERAMGKEAVIEKIRELLYCDLYEMRF